MLSEQDLDLAKAVEIATAMELADKQSQSFQVPPAQAQVEVKRVSGTSPTRKEKPWSRNEDRFKEVVCFKCNKKGHLTRNCCSKKKYAPGGNSEREASRQQKTTNWVGDQESSGEEATVQTIYVVESGLEEPMKIKLLVNGEQLEPEIDTGAAVSIIPHRIWKKHFSTVPLKISHVTLRTYMAEPMEVMGTISVPVVYQKQNRKLRFFVVRTDGPSLLGRE